jgi:hypothetical protein
VTESNPDGVDHVDHIDHIDHDSQFADHDLAEREGVPDERPVSTFAPPVGDRAIEAPTDDTGANDAIAALTRRTNLMVGVLAALLVGAFVVIGLLFGRVADAEADAEAARSTLAAGGGASSTEIDELRAEIERVEAGAALYASQIEGFQEQLVELEPQISAGVEEAITGLREFGDSTIEFDVAIDEVIPIDTEVVINRTVEVPIETEIPINQEIETTITINTPLGDVPVDVTVPVDVVVPIDITVDIPIDETIPIQDEFPVQLDVPIAIDVSETELANLTESLASGLESLQDMLTGLSG